MFALDPDLNVRLYTAGVPASRRAAERWLSTSNAEVAARHLLFETKPGNRALLAGTPEELLHRAAEFGSAGAEVAAAVHTFEQTLHAPPRPLVMGILNVTPDSFSDGGLWIDTGRAVEHALEMVEQGADILDLGGESTRPGAQEVPADEELGRLLPVVEKLRPQVTVPISIDTRKAAVAAPCLDAGADWINDVSGLTFDPALAEAAAARPEVKLVLMHSRSRPADEVYSTEWSAGGPVYEDVVADTLRWLRRQACFAVERGVRPEQIWIDPGFGFGKTFEQNIELLSRLREYTSAGLPVLVGTSRKSSVGRLVGDLPPEERLEGTAATVAWSVANGAAAVRVHDVREMARVVRAAYAICVPPGTESLASVV